MQAFLKSAAMENLWQEGGADGWYTHRKIRAARSLIRNALPHLFIFIDHPYVPRTTNHVEGGVNSRLKELVHRHRGLRDDRKQVLVAVHLARKRAKKPPRNVT